MATGSVPYTDRILATVIATHTKSGSPRRSSRRGIGYRDRRAVRYATVCGTEQEAAQASNGFRHCLGGCAWPSRNEDRSQVVNRFVRQSPWNELHVACACFLEAPACVFFTSHAACPR